MIESAQAVALLDDVGTIDEDDLIRRAQADATEFAPLYWRYVTPVYRYIRSRVELEQDALDLTQVVFLSGLEALPRYQVSGAPFAAWLFCIARNAVADHHRRRRRSLSVGPLLVVRPEDWADDPAELAQQNESARELKKLVAAENPYRRELLALRFAGGLKLREISHIVGKPEATVKSDIRRTLLRMKEKVNDGIR